MQSHAIYICTLLLASQVNPLRLPANSDIGSSFLQPQIMDDILAQQGALTQLEEQVTEQQQNNIQRSFPELADQESYTRDGGFSSDSARGDDTSNRSRDESTSTFDGDVFNTDDSARLREKSDANGDQGLDVAEGRYGGSRLGSSYGS